MTEGSPCPWCRQETPIIETLVHVAQGMPEPPGFVRWERSPDDLQIDLAAMLRRPYRPSWVADLADLALNHPAIAIVHRHQVLRSDGDETLYVCTAREPAPILPAEA